MEEKINYKTEEIGKNYFLVTASNPEGGKYFSGEIKIRTISKEKVEIFEKSKKELFNQKHTIENTV